MRVRCIGLTPGRDRGGVHARDHLGHTIAYDWTAHVIAARAAGRTDADLSLVEANEIAESESDAIADASVFILLEPIEPITSVGAWVEFGIAITNARYRHGYAICVVGQARATIYGARADFVFQSTGHALRWLGRVDDVTT